MSNRWFFAVIETMGDHAFRCASIPESGTVEVRNLTRITRDASGVQLERSPVYGIGFANDPLTLKRDRLLLAGLAAKKLAESCDECWSDVKIAPESALRALKGGD